MLRSESANLDRDGKPIQERAEDFGTLKYSKAYQLLSTWIESNLDIYKVIKNPFQRYSIIFLTPRHRLSYADSFGLPLFIHSLSSSPTITQVMEKPF